MCVTSLCTRGALDKWSRRRSTAALDAIRLNAVVTNESMVIRFRNPKLERMHNGNLCVELTEAGTWESFEGFAEAWAWQIGAAIRDRIDGPDARAWRIVYEGYVLRLVYNDYPNGISVEAPDAESNVAIDRLFSVVSSEAVPNGV